VSGLLRLAQMLAMIVWVGGIIFFAFVLAPVAFHTLPSIHEAGLVVGESLRVFDIVALVAGALFLVSTGLLSRGARHSIKRRYGIEFLLAGVMILATAYIHWSILPHMDADRMQAGGDIALVAPNSVPRADFDRLHQRSERLEGAVLLLGLAVVFLLSREPIRIE
jgi:uncharacterized membrane protein